MLAATDRQTANRRAQAPKEEGDIRHLAARGFCKKHENSVCAKKGGGIRCRRAMATRRWFTPPPSLGSRFSRGTSDLSTTWQRESLNAAPIRPLQRRLRRRAAASCACRSCQRAAGCRAGLRRRQNMRLFQNRRVVSQGTSPSVFRGSLRPRNRTAPWPSEGKTCTSCAVSSVARDRGDRDAD